MFSFFEAKRVETAEPKWRITVDGYKNYRVKYIAQVDGVPNFHAILSFKDRTFANMQQAETAIAAYEEDTRKRKQTIVKEF